MIKLNENDLLLLFFIKPTLEIRIKPLNIFIKLTVDQN